MEKLLTESVVQELSADESAHIIGGGEPRFYYNGIGSPILIGIIGSAAVGGLHEVGDPVPGQ